MCRPHYSGTECWIFCDLVFISQYQSHAQALVSFKIVYEIASTKLMLPGLSFTVNLRMKWNPRFKFEHTEEMLVIFLWYSGTNFLLYLSSSMASHFYSQSNTCTTIYFFSFTGSGEMCAGAIDRTVWYLFRTIFELRWPWLSTRGIDFHARGPGREVWVRFPVITIAFQFC